MAQRLTKKRALFALFFLLTSCSNSQPQWSCRETATHCQDYNSRKVFYPAKNRFRGIELEIATTASGQRMYANVFSIPFPQDLPKKTKVTIKIDQEAFETLADRFEGGQRLLFTDQAADKILTALDSNQTVSLNIGRYQAEIPPKKL